MKKITLKHLIAREIEVLNRRIDQKILEGVSYRRDAEKHRALVAQYRRVKNRQRMHVSVGSLLAA